MMPTLRKHGQFTWSMAGRGSRRDVPASIQGLAARFIADDLIGVVADAAAVTTWTDATGNGNDAGNTGSNRPVFDASNPQFNNHASVNFTAGSTQYLFSSTGPLMALLSGSDVDFEIIACVRRSTKVTTAEQMLWSLGNSGSGTQRYCAGSWYDFGDDRQFLSTRVRDDAGTTETRTNGRVEITDLGPQVLAWSMTGAAAKHFVVGASQNPHYDGSVDSAVSGADYSSQGEITFDRFAIGAFLRSTATLPATFELTELLVYSRALSEAERVRVCDYLWNRYIAVNNGAIPTRLDLTVAHHWDCSATADLPGERCTRVYNGADVANDLVASGDARPTVRLDAVSGNQYLEFDGVGNVMNPEAATAANWTFLHSAASSYGVWMVVRVPSSAGSAYQPLLDTNGNSTTAQGIAVGADATSGAHSLQLKIGNGSTNVLNHDSQDYGLRPDVWHVIHFTVEAGSPSTEERYQIWIDNENYAASNAANAADADAAVGSLLVGKLVGAATFGRFDLGEIYITNTKPGRPGESQLVNEYLARKWKTSHAALAAGNGFANIMNDAAPHRGFPAVVQDATGIWHCIYRRGATHGSSRGVGVQITSADGMRWSHERVIYDVDDADGRDFRGECGLIRLTQGAHAGRLVLTSKWSADDSSIYVAGQRSTLLVGYSDDNGGSWTWLDPVASDADLANWSYTASPNGLIELQTGVFAGRILFAFSSNSLPWSDVTNQDIRLVYSDDGGVTWSQSTIIITHDDELGVNKRVTETHIVEFADGELLMSIRNDTDLEIWLGHSDSATPLVWTIDSAKAFDGYGRPVMAIDPNDPDGVWIFYRSDPGLATVYRYSDDRGATWGSERAFSNLHSTTTITSHNTMAYCYPAYDLDGNLWVGYALERQPDADVFMRRWVNAE